MKSDIPRILKLLLLAGLLGVCFLDYGAYRESWLHNADAHSVASPSTPSGFGEAPGVYRVAIIWLADRMDRHLHIGPHRCFALIDTASLLLAAMLLLKLLERTAIYRNANRQLQWFGATAFVLLFQFYLAWLLFLQRAETLPTALFLALALWLWQLNPSPNSTVRNTAIASALLAIAFLQSFVRADVPCMLNAGIFLAACTSLGKRLSLPRSLAIATSLFSTLIAAGVQLYLAKVVFPHANYGRVKMWQLRPNFIHGLRWIPFLLFMLPLLWMAFQITRRKFTTDAPGVAFLAGAAAYTALWFTIGKIDEVRIFIPFALALAPLTVEIAMFHAASSLAASSTFDQPTVNAEAPPPHAKIAL